MFDAVESVFLLLVLGGHGGEPAPLTATICSSVKLTLITIATRYVLRGFGVAAATATRVKRTLT
jgi:hypothetical protein